MRTDVKVGLICVFAIILAVVIYFVAQGNARGRGTLAADSASAAPNTPAGNAPAAHSAAPATPPSTLATPAIAEAPLASPPAAAAATPTIPAVTPATPPAEPLQLAQANIPDPASRGLIPPPTPYGTIPSAGPGAAPGGTSALPSTPAGTPPATPAGGTPSFGSPSFGGGGPAGLGNNSGLSSGPATRPGIDSAITLEPAPRPGSRETVRPLPNPGGASFGNRSTLGSTPALGTTPGNTHTIQKGDMLGTIAKKYGVSVKAIETANPGLDPTRLKINSTIKIPASTLTPGTPSFAGSTPSNTSTLSSAPTPWSPSTPTTPATAGLSSGNRTPVRTAGAAGTSRIAARPGSSYTIKRGDSLTTIAVAVYGDKAAWRRIYRANRGELTDANTIPVGTTIRLPE
jgi:LysM repeat protein